MNRVQLCWNDLEERLQSVAVLNKQVFKVSSPNQLGAKLKALPPPAVGVIYEGLRSVGQPGVGLNKGLSTNAVFGLYMTFSSASYAPGIDIQTPITDILHQMRLALLEKDSPSSHGWQFLVEAFVDSNSTHEIWMQKWQTPVILTDRS
jgi:hypothetical protein